METPASEPVLALVDERAFVDSASAVAALGSKRDDLGRVLDEAKDRTVRLARRITEDWRLTDEEAVERAGAIALERLHAAAAEVARAGTAS